LTTRGSRSACKDAGLLDATDEYLRADYDAIETRIAIWDRCRRRRNDRCRDRRPQSAVLDEAENRLHAQKTILNWCLSTGVLVSWCIRKRRSASHSSLSRVNR
jgi:hypothetical protein